MSSRAPERIPVVDLIRLFSIIPVMGLHFFLSGVSKGYPPLLWQGIIHTFANGTFGVSCFFVVSGFVITKMLVGPSGNFQGLNLKAFYVRRVARLFPLLAVVLLAGLAILATHPQSDYAMSLCYRGPNSHFEWGFWASLFTFTFNWFILLSHQDVSFHWGVLWSLAVEEQFYLFYPLLVKALGNRRKVMLFLAGVVLSAILFRAGVHLWAPRDFLMSTIASFGVFDQIALGALTYFLLPFAEDLFKKRPWFSGLFFFGGAVLVLAVYYGTSIVDTGLLIWTPTCLALGCALMIIGGIHLKFMNGQWMKILSWPGQLSYGAYLWHVTFLFLFWPVFSAMGPWAPLLYFPGVGLFCYVSYRWFERPANAWVRQVFGKKPGKPFPDIASKERLGI